MRTLKRLVWRSSASAKCRRFAKALLLAFASGFMAFAAQAEPPDQAAIESAKQQFRKSQNDPAKRAENAKVLYPLIKPGMARADIFNLLGPPDRAPKRESQARFINYLIGDKQIEIELDRQREFVAVKREVGLGIDPPRKPVLPIPEAMTAYLSDYPVEATDAANRTTLRAGFYPSKPQIVWGEPLTLTMSVANIGNADFEFMFGGDYRGTGRHNRIKIRMTDANGNELPDPRANAPEFGGIMVTELITPGGVDYTQLIELTKFRTITGPGQYMVDCRFALDEDHVAVKGPARPVIHSRFPLTILERTPQRVSAVLDELQEKLDASSDAQLPEATAAIARFGQNDAVPRLAAYAKAGATTRRIAAIAALPLIPGDASLNVAFDAIKDSDAAIRSAAYSAIGQNPSPRGVDELLDALKRESSPVKESILIALGTSKSPRGLEVLTRTLDEPSALRFAAVSALVRFGGSQAIDVLRQHAESTDLAFRYQVVRALVNDLGSPLDPDWLMPILMCRRHNSREWLDSLSMIRVRCGEQAVPILLSCVDYDVPWSHRNFWVLHNAKYAKGAPEFDYLYDPNSAGSVDQHAKNRETLAKLRPLAGPIGDSTVWPPAAVPMLETNPSIDFTATLTDPTGDDKKASVRCGFFKETWNRTSGSVSFQPSDEYKAMYQTAGEVRRLLGSPDQIKKAGLTEQQVKELRALQIPLPSPIIEEGLSLLYIWWQESPEGPIRQRAKDELCESVRAAVQRHHTNHAMFAAAARKILEAR